MKQKMNRLAKNYIRKNGNNFSIENTVDGDKLIVKVKGVSAHSSKPEQGVNPVSRMCDYLNMAVHELDFARNHYAQAVRYASDNFGLDYYGKKLGINYSDDFMGPLTAAVTYIKETDKHLEIAVNTRAPRGKEPGELIAEITDRLEEYKTKTKMNFELNVSSRNYMYRNPKGEWINTLLNVFGEVTGGESKLISSSGGTTAKQLPNGVSFGPSMPDEKYMGHNANEFKKISNFLLDVQMFTEMFLRIGNLESMD